LKIGPQTPNLATREKNPAGASGL